MSTKVKKAVLNSAKPSKKGAKEVLSPVKSTKTLKTQNTLSKTAASEKSVSNGLSKAPADATLAMASGTDQDELDDQEGAGLSLGGGESSSDGGGDAAALAAASGSTEMSASFKNFRHHPDMENFYRFIYENDLRQEAAVIIDKMMLEKLARRQVKTLKANAH